MSNSASSPDLSGESLPKYPYEFHVTVPAQNTDIGLFKEACSELKVKPIVLDLELNRGAVMKDVMTSSKLKGTDEDAYSELERISDGLINSGFTVIRKKIETAPWHSSAPSIASGNLLMPDNSYFECHFGVHTQMSARPDLDILVKSLSNDIGKLHLSRNAFKAVDNGELVVMATYREYTGTSEAFQEKVSMFASALMDKYIVERPIVEFTLFDTKVNHDAQWINSTCLGCLQTCDFKVSVEDLKSM